MNYWLVKTEPATYSWDNLVAEKRGTWDGVRNFKARSYLKAMKKGDQVFIYHTGDEKAVIGVGVVFREAFPEPKDNTWYAVNIEAKKKLKRPVTLAEIKATKKLSAMVLARVPRLSVQPVTEAEFDTIIEMSKQ
jgi:predicted RNA-binding protein with PUA-like domain